MSNRKKKRVTIQMNFNAGKPDNVIENLEGDMNITIHQTDISEPKEKPQKPVNPDTEAVEVEPDEDTKVQHFHGTVIGVAGNVEGKRITTNKEIK